MRAPTNPTGKGAPRFTRLQRIEALRIVQEHFGVVNEKALDAIEVAIGRRPTAQAVRKWAKPVQERQAEKRAREIASEIENEKQLSETINRYRNEPLTLPADLSSLEKSVSQFDERTTDEKLTAVLDKLISLTDDQINKMAPDKRLRLFEPLSLAWQRRREIEPEILDALPALRDLIATNARANKELGHTWTVDQKELTLLAMITHYNDSLNKAIDQALSGEGTTPQIEASNPNGELSGIYEQDGRYWKRVTSFTKDGTPYRHAVEVQVIELEKSTDDRKNSLDDKVNSDTTDDILYYRNQIISPVEASTDQERPEILLPESELEPEQPIPVLALDPEGAPDWQRTLELTIEEKEAQAAEQERKRKFNQWQNRAFFGD